YAALPGLALLACGAAPTDPALQRVARFVRQHAPTLNKTYELALAVLFLDRLGEPQDRPLIRRFAPRLLAGHAPAGPGAQQRPVPTRPREPAVPPPPPQAEGPAGPRPRPPGQAPRAEEPA